MATTKTNYLIPLKLIGNDPQKGLITEPASIPVKEATFKARRESPQIYFAAKQQKISFGQVSGVNGKRVILNEAWDVYVAECKRLDAIYKKFAKANPGEPLTKQKLRFTGREKISTIVDKKQTPSTER